MCQNRTWDAWKPSRNCERWQSCRCTGDAHPVEMLENIARSTGSSAHRSNNRIDARSCHWVSPVYWSNGLSFEGNFRRDWIYAEKPKFRPTRISSLRTTSISTVLPNWREPMEKSVPCPIISYRNPGVITAPAWERSTPTICIQKCPIREASVESFQNFKLTFCLSPHPTVPHTGKLISSRACPKLEH
jgi:hypothetical protein